MYLATNIQLIRKWLRDSQESFGDRFKVVRTTVSKWEAGDSEPPIGALLILQDLTGVTVADMVRREITSEMLKRDHVARELEGPIYGGRVDKDREDVAALLEAVNALRISLEAEREAAAFERNENARFRKEVEFLKKKVEIMDSEITRLAGKRK